MLNANVTKQLGDFRVEASLTAQAGQTLVLVGESGAGKTTILNLLAGLIEPDQGQVKLDGVFYFDDQRKVSVPPHDRPIGYVFQDYVLFPHLSVYSNVAFGLRAQHLPEREIRKSTWEIMEQIMIVDLAKKRPRELSGGQQQRVALARALAVKPRLLFLDEPLAALDVHTKREVRTELRRTLSQLPCVTILVTHSPFEALVFGDCMSVVEQGRIVQTGVGNDLLRRPRSRYVATLMGLNFFQGKVTSRTHDGLAEIQTPHGPVHALSEDVHEETFIAVDPREITLHTVFPKGTAQNVFQGTIVELVPEPPMGERFRVVLATHPPLVAEVTAHSVQTLGLREGMMVFASFKATAARSYN